MTERSRFHPVYSLAILKKPAIVLAVPPLAALRDRDLEALFRALGQELALTLLLLLLGVFLWRQAGWRLENDTLYWRRGFFGPAATGSLKPRNLACAAVVRSWYLRPIGAVRLELGLETGETLHFYLSRPAAQALAETLLPSSGPGRDLTPKAGEKALLALLNCDLFATLLVLGVSMHNTSQLFGREWVETLARTGIDRTAALLGRWLPAGFAALAAAAFFLAAATLGLAALRTANYTLTLGEGVLVASGGLLSPTRWVVRRQSVTCADLRYTPVARLTGRYPLFITAGGFTGSALLLCRGRDDPRLAELLPTARFMPAARQNTAGRSLPAFLLRPGLALGLCLAGWWVLWRRPLLLPMGLWLLPVATALSLGWLLVGFEGWLYDGAALTPAGQPMTVTTRAFTHHHYCLLHATAATLFSNPFSQRVGRCDLTLHLPGHKKVRVKSLGRREAETLAENIKERYYV